MLRSLFFLPLLIFPALGQYGEFGVVGGASRLSSNKIGDVMSDGRSYDAYLDNGWLLGFRVTLNSGTFYGHEFGYQYNRTTLRYIPTASTEPAFEGGMAIHRSGYNFLLYALPEGAKVRPFVTGGGHFANFVPPGASVQYGQGENKFGFNYGAGIKFRVTDRWMFRMDLREYNQSKPFRSMLTNQTGRLRQQEYSIGVSYTL